MLRMECWAPVGVSSTQSSPNCPNTRCTISKQHAKRDMHLDICEEPGKSVRSKRILMCRVWSNARYSWRNFVEFPPLSTSRRRIGAT